MAADAPIQPLAIQSALGAISATNWLQRMLTRMHLLVFVFLSGCAAQQEQVLPQGIWHDNEQLGQFSETWSSCHHFRATTPDLKWMLDIDVSAETGTFEALELVTLLDFSGLKDRECEVSLYKNNDIECEDREPVRIPASDGDGKLRHVKRVPDRKSTFDLDIHNLVFEYRDQEIRIDRITFSNVVYSNFCPG